MDSKGSDFIGQNFFLVVFLGLDVDDFTPEVT